MSELLVPPPVDDAATILLVKEEIDAINAGRNWPGSRPNPCPGDMWYEREPIEGIDVTEGDRVVEFRVAGVSVGWGSRWTAIGNAYVWCLLPHDPYRHDGYVVALNHGGVVNAFQLHLLTMHGTHGYNCHSWHRDQRCPLCQ